MATRSKATANAPIPTWDPPDIDTSPIQGASPFQLTKVANLPQLEAELAVALGIQSVYAVMVGPGDPTQPMSSENFTVLWVSPSAVDPQTVYNTIAAHVPDPDWGVPKVINDFNAVWALLTENPEMTLDSEQQTQLLLGLVFRVMNTA